MKYRTFKSVYTVSLTYYIHMKVGEGEVKADTNDVEHTP